MVKLETQEKVVHLGKKLISNFKQSEPDEITAWMINYLAEQIVLAEDGSCEQAKKNCFETILQLWESHSIFPNGSRPFENLEPIFKALDSLSPESVTPRYFIKKTFMQSDELNDASKWLKTATKIDATARTLITFMLEQAIDNTVNEDTKEWIKTLSGTVDVGEVNFMVWYDNEKPQNKTQQRIDKLTSRINNLKTFEDLSQSIRQELNEELSLLNHNNAS